MPLPNPFKKRDAKAPRQQKQEEKPSFQEPVGKGGRTSVIPSKVLRAPRVTEKAVRLAESNRYVFEVYRGTSKGQVKDAVEQVYGVDVVGVRTVSIPPKRVRLRRRRGTGVKQGMKKAIVEVKEGQKIEILPV